nr:uncharacterized protein LOC110642325 isoform X1 [Ipomoea trifida]
MDGVGAEYRSRRLKQRRFPAWTSVNDGGFRRSSPGEAEQRQGEGHLRSSSPSFSDDGKLVTRLRRLWSPTSLSRFQLGSGSRNSSSCLGTIVGRRMQVTRQASRFLNVARWQTVSAVSSPPGRTSSSQAVESFVSVLLARRTADFPAWTSVNDGGFRRSSPGEAEQRQGEGHLRSSSPSFSDDGKLVTRLRRLWSPTSLSRFQLGSGSRNSSSCLGTIVGRRMQVTRQASRFLNVARWQTVSAVSSPPGRTSSSQAVESFVSVLLARRTAEAITGEVTKTEEEREKSQNWRKREPGRQTGRTPGPRPVPGFESIRPRSDGRKSDARPARVRQNAVQMPPKSTASKSRRKECAKKRKHDVGSSSRAAEGESDLLIPGGRSLRHLSGAQIARVEELRAKGASGGYYFDLSMLDAYGCREEVERMMSRRSWEHLFSWRDDTYEPVVHEFIATYMAIPSNHMWTPCMKFTLFGEILGFYTPEDSRTEEWRNLPTDFDSDAVAEAYWYEITNGRGGRFTRTKPNTSKVVRAPLLMMKLLLNLTFGGRNKNLHKIYRFDLFNLWSLEMNEPIQMACMVQQLFTSQTQPKCPYVWIGPVVTRLCHGLGLQAELAREKSIASMQPFKDAHLNRSYAPRIGAAPRPRRDEQPQEQEPVVQGGPDVPPEYAEYPPVYDWASMRAFQLQLHNQSMNVFNQRMDLHHEELMRQNEASARQNEAYVRQEERQEQQFLAIEQLCLWMEQRFPPPSQGGDAS